MGKRGNRAGRRNIIPARDPEHVEKVKIFARVNDLFTTFREIVGTQATQCIYHQTYRVR